MCTQVDCPGEGGLDNLIPTLHELSALLRADVVQPPNRHGSQNKDTDVFEKKKNKRDLYVVTFTKKWTLFALKMLHLRASKYVHSLAVKIFCFVANVNLQKSYQINRTLKEVLYFERQSRNTNIKS